MSTGYQKAKALLERLEGQVPQLQGWDTSTGSAEERAAWSAAINEGLEALQAAGTDKLLAKAKETDPDKRVYGEGMREKVIGVAKRLQAMHTELSALAHKAESLAEEERATAAQDAAARAAAEEAAARAAEEAAAQERALAETAAQQAAAEQQAAKEEADRKAREEETRRAAEEAKKKKQRDLEAAAADAAAEKHRGKQAVPMEEEAPSQHRQEAAAEKEPAAADAPSTAAPAAAPPASQPGQSSAGGSTQKAPGSVPAAAAAAAAPSAPPAPPAAPAQQRRAPPGYVPSPEASRHVPAWGQPRSQQPGVFHVHHGSHEVDFFTQGEFREGLTVVDFSASWCGPCRMMKPVLETLAQRFHGVAAFLAVDCEETPENRSLAAAQAIRGFPTFHIYSRGRSIEQFSGARPEAAFEAMLNGHIAKVGAKDQGMQDALLAALQALKAGAPPEAFNKAYSTLLKIVGNLVDKPAERKFRCIRKAGGAFHEALGKLPGGYDALRAVGFRDATEPNGDEGRCQASVSLPQVFLAEHLCWDLPRLRQLLRDAQQGMTTAAPAAQASRPQAVQQVSPQQVSPELLAAISGLPRPPAAVQSAGPGVPAAAAPDQASTQPALSQEQIAAIAQQMMLHLARSQSGTSAAPTAGAAPTGAAASTATGSGGQQQGQEEDMDAETAEALRRSLEDAED